MTVPESEFPINVYPMRCPLCFRVMQDAEDRASCHGFGRCAELCEGCFGDGQVKDRECTRCSGNGTEKRAIAFGTGVQKGPMA